MKTESITLIVDSQTKRPGCVLLQSCYGCGHHNSFLSLTFDSKHWLLAPTKKMVRVTGTSEQWERHAKMLDIKSK